MENEEIPVLLGKFTARVGRAITTEYTTGVSHSIELRDSSSVDVALSGGAVLPVDDPVFAQALVGKRIEIQVLIRVLPGVP